MTTAAKAPPRADQCCVACRRPFIFGPKSDPHATVYSPEGKHEVAISGMCERCFDDVTQCDEDDDL